MVHRSNGKLYFSLASSSLFTKYLYCRFVNGLLKAEMLRTACHRTSKESCAVLGGRKLRAVFACVPRLLAKRCLCPPSLRRARELSVEEERDVFLEAGPPKRAHGHHEPEGFLMPSLSLVRAFRKSVRHQLGN